MDSKSNANRRIRAIMELDPGALIRVLQHFQARNVVPRHISARSLGTEYIEIELDVAGLFGDAVQQIVAKIRSAPTAIAAVVCD